MAGEVRVAKIEMVLVIEEAKVAEEDQVEKEEDWHGSHHGVKRMTIMIERAHKEESKVVCK